MPLKKIPKWHVKSHEGNYSIYPTFTIHVGITGTEDRTLAARREVNSVAMRVECSRHGSRTRNSVMMSTVFWDMIRCSYVKSVV
jgi:hypothetical protein